MSTDRIAKWTSKKKTVIRSSEDLIYISTNDRIWINFKKPRKRQSYFYECEVLTIRELLTCATEPIESIYKDEISKRFLFVKTKRACRLDKRDPSSESFIHVVHEKIDDSIYRLKGLTSQDIRFNIEIRAPDFKEIVSKMSEKWCKNELKTQGVSVIVKGVENWRQLVLKHRFEPYLPARTRYVLSLSVPEIKEYLRYNGLKLGGKKDVLLQRLLDYEENIKMQQNHELQDEEEETDEELDVVNDAECEEFGLEEVHF